MNRYAMTLATVTITGGMMMMSITGSAEPTDAQDDARPAADDQPRQGFPDLVSGLRSIEGCLGVDSGQMTSGKNVIFAWFEDKEAAMRWYQHEMHKGVMRIFFPDIEPSEREPMADVPDDVPLLVIASLTPASDPQRRETGRPVSQIAIEIYTPVTGGLHVGGRFAPDSLEVPKMRDYTPRGDR